MRIAVLTWSRRRIAGIEAYLATVVRALEASGHEVLLVSEVDQPADRDLIASGSISTLCVASLGRTRLLSELREWHPDVLYGHGLHDPMFESAILEIAPAVFFPHGYHGTCISGAKCFKAPVTRPCDRRFGWPCLLHYYPHRCGGWSPATMVRDYMRQVERLKLLPRYAAVVTHSRRMKAEYLKHGVSSERMHLVPYCTEDFEQLESPTDRPAMSSMAERPHLVFLGRMTHEKGGHVLLDALPQIVSLLGRAVRVTFAGDGPKRHAWELQAAHLHERFPELEVNFTGWLPPAERDVLLDESDLLVVPSIWPEPLGLVGVEAGRRGVPSAAFDVGGIPDWLDDGVSGFLAPGDPPTAKGLATAVARCLRDPETLFRLRRGAVEVASRHTLAEHMRHLEPILATIAQGTRAPRQGKSS